MPTAITRPSAGPISSPFGFRQLPNEPPTFHGGIDFVGAYGSRIKAVQSGTVVAAAPNGTFNRYGNVIVIKHDDPSTAPYSLYAHLSSMRVRKGQHVNAGQVIGAMGNLAATKMEPYRMVRTHLHFELLKQWPAQPDVGRVDPTRYLTVQSPVYASAPPVTPGTGPLLYPASSPFLYPAIQEGQGPLLYPATGLTGLDAFPVPKDALLLGGVASYLGFKLSRGQTSGAVLGGLVGVGAALLLGRNA
jgi:murein DD-endopeptidase MepM/ murein hydrolase activator NlpD